MSFLELQAQRSRNHRVELDLMIDLATTNSLISACASTVDTDSDTDPRPLLGTYLLEQALLKQSGMTYSVLPTASRKDQLSICNQSEILTQQPVCNLVVN